MATSIPGTKPTFGAWIRRYRVQSECIGLALFAAIVFVVLGITARRRTEPVRAELTKWMNASSEISGFRAAFRPSTPERDSRIGRMPDSLGVAVSRELRVSLAEQVATRAERAGLSDVRVRFALPDSAAAPNRPELTGVTVGVADYTIALDCTGEFAAVLSLVNHLPPSVALQRMTANRTRSGAQYRLVLAVFESSGPIHHG
jgi:hypothetical protein